MPEAETVKPWRAEGDGLETPFREPSERERSTQMCASQFQVLLIIGFDRVARLGWRITSQTLQRGRGGPDKTGHSPPNNGTLQPKSGFYSGTVAPGW
jgi:hypothetical protein